MPDVSSEIDRPALRAKVAQSQNERGSLPGLGSRPNFTFMGLHDLVDHRQAQASSTLKVRLKGFENLFCLLRSHSGSSVGKGDLPVVAQALDTDSQAATVAHRAHRVLTEIPENLFDPVAVRQRPGFPNIQVALDYDAGIFRSHAVAHQGQSVLQQRHQVGFFEAILLAAGIREEVGDDAVKALRFPGNNIEQLAVLGAHLRNTGEHADRTGDGSERIADFVRNGSRQTPYGGEAILHAHFTLQTANLP